MCEVRSDRIERTQASVQASSARSPHLLTSSTALHHGRRPNFLQRQADVGPRVSYRLDQRYQEVRALECIATDVRRIEERDD